MKYYSVRIDGKSWSANRISIEDFTSRGYTVKDSRRNGDKDVFFESQKVATLFATKRDAATYAANVG